jgi:hypothetical protein
MFISLAYICFQSYSSLLIMILPFSVGYSTCPTCQDNPLQYRRSNLCFGMLIYYSGSTKSRYAMLDPTFIRLASDKRKAPSLIASPAVKKKRTSKKLLIQVRTPSPTEHNVIHYSDHLNFCLISDQNSTTSGHYRICQCFIYW